MVRMQCVSLSPAFAVCSCLQHVCLRPAFLLCGVLCNCSTRHGCLVSLARCLRTGAGGRSARSRVASARLLLARRSALRGSAAWRTTRFIFAEEERAYTVRQFVPASFHDGSACVHDRCAACVCRCIRLVVYVYVEEGTGTDPGTAVKLQC